MYICRPLIFVPSILLIITLVSCGFGGATEPQPPTPTIAPSPTAVAESPTPTAEPTPTTEPTPTAEPTPTEAATPTPEVREGGTLTIRLDADVRELRPWDLNSRGAEQIAALMYSGLVRLDPAGRPQPDLAEEWTASEDGTSLTFKLRDGVRWHDGEPFTADDVAWTLNMLRTMTASTSLLYDLRTIIEQVSAPDDRTVELALTAPYAPLLAELAVPILPRHRLQDRSPEELMAFDFWEVPVGTGPFKYDRRESDQAILFTRNDDFYRGEPYLERVALLIAPDPAVAIRALGEESLLVAEFSDPAQLDAATLPDTTIRDAYVENGWYGVVFNVREGRLFADGRLREALARAIDVPALVRDIVGDSGAPIATTIISNTWAYPSGVTVAPADVEGARQLLEEAGWTVGGDGVRQQNGQRLATQLFVRGDDQRRLAAAQRIAEAAQQIGMELDVVPANFDTVILAKLAPPYDFDLLLGSWVNAPNSSGFPTNHFYDPDDFALFHSSRVWQGDGDTRSALRNVGGFQNEQYDAAAEQARSTYDLDQRAATIAEAQAVLQDQRPYLFLWSNRVAVVLNQRVSSAADPIALDSPRYLWNVEQWYLAGGE